MTTRRVAIVTGVSAVVLLVSVPGLLLVQGTRSSAAFGDAEALGSNRLAAATLDIDIGSLSQPLRVANMAPGDSAVGEVIVRNAGSLPLRYALSAQNDRSLLAGALRWDVWLAGEGCVRGVGQTDPALVAQNLYLSSGATDLIGGLGTSGQRVLGVGEQETVCLRAVLPPDVPNDLQGRATAITLIATAEHELGDR